MAPESMEERGARLQALRLAAELSAATENSDAGGESITPAVQDANPEPELTIRFRNYVPRDEKLQEFKVPPPSIPKFDDPVAKGPEETHVAEDPIISIAPKKPNWDLRRDVAKKLEKLERRTQRAIIELMQEEEEKRRQAAVEAENGID